MSENEAFYFNKKGNDLTEEGQYEKAIVYYMHAIRILPEEPIFYHNMGVCLLLNKDFVNATKYFKLSLEKGLFLDETYLYLAESLYETNNYAEVITIKEPEAEQIRYNILLLKSKSALKSNNKKLAKKYIDSLKIMGYDSQEISLIEQMAFYKDDLE
ncbi:MAG TPA: tetratricopeptide repeat protein [Defluviitoga sp.]|nr:tetratricopeptide repeat protein [Defluviitoga sp.]HOP24280.1 tetratricopeptide repeat protein [Defluviitoga sp.]HPZ28128.1 tetratricopeptide repeat protein [Defluviitoga sp.]HQD62018.1 tetratricopeptide repeat protein [Defluviitoga sp.]